MTDDVRFSAAAQRNAEPIRALLARVLPDQGRVLEIASGSGQHVVHFAAAFPGLHWQPSDADPAARRSVDARVSVAALDNCAAALELDVCGPWPAVHADAVLVVNLLHVSPWAAAVALFDGASRLLARNAPLLIYGPFRRDGRHTSPGNREFDITLRARNAAWGLRDLEAVTRAGADAGLALQEVVDMPANNLSLVFIRV